MKGGSRMSKSSGNIQVRTTVNNGHRTRTTTKTIRVK